MKRTVLGAWIGGALCLAFAPVVSAQTVQSNTVTVTAGHYVQTGTEQVPQTVTVPEQQCQTVTVPEVATYQTQNIEFYQMDWNTMVIGPLEFSGPVTWSSGEYPNGCIAYRDMTNQTQTGYCAPIGTITTYTATDYVTQQQCQTVYVQQTQYVTQPTYTWVPTSVS
ncbi:hypothetical protein [Alicyclobacillus fructus]|uniref:hypothetical protein n=1 Tax=Alicyclobacillus fructus TaxID=2816082 RepID=UPI001A8F6785|nr:hypothetical protein [Alicyclobacillus fructus]